MPPREHPTQDRLRSTLIDEAFRQGRAGIPMTAIAMLGVAWLHWANTQQMLEPAWLIFGLGVTLVRGMLLLAHERRRDRLSMTARARMFEWPLIATAIVWGVLPLLTFPDAGPPERFGMIAVCAGMAGGGTSILAPVVWPARLYIACLMIPASILIFDTPGSGPVVSALGLCFVVVMLVSHAQARRQLVVAQQRLIENQGLMSDMQSQQALVKALNRELLSAQESLVKHNARLEQQVEERTARMQLAFAVIENTAEGVMVMSPDGVIVEVNPAFTRITGYASDEVIGGSARVLRSSRHNADYFDALWQRLRSEGKWDGEMWSRRKDGEVFLERRTIDAVHGAEGEVTYFVCVFNDVTDEYHKDQRLLYQALHDPLTGLGNRKLLLDRLSQGIAQARRSDKRLGVLILDLDQFKSVNDSLGHHIGDQLLRSVAERLGARVRASDTLVRLGGDEFVVLMTNLEDPQDAAVLARDLLDSFARPFDLPDNRIHIRTSLGIAICPDDGTDPDVLMKNADMALYAAKAAGRNTLHFFQPAFAEDARQRLELEIALRDAIEHNELSLYYQAKVKAAGHGSAGFEALLRWHRKDHGPVPPDRFIPIAEECGLIGQIGAWVLSEACRQIARWHRLGYGWQKIAINVSARQLIHDDLVSMIRSECERWEIAPALIEVEVTESCVMSNPERTTPILNAIRAMQATVAVDDFGTGHSSLAYLRRLPVDVIKIDRSFVKEASEDAGAEAIVKTIVELSKTLKMQVVAEGVETPEQGAMLARIGCDILQGYCFARPLPAAEIERQWQRQDHTPATPAPLG